MLGFDESPHTLDIETGEARRGDGVVVRSVRYTGWLGDRVTGEISEPTGVPWGGVLVAHGITGSATSPYIRGAAHSWARGGLVTVATDAPLHGGRAGDWFPDPLTMGSVEVYSQAVGDLRRGADVLRRRLDSLPLGMVGFSMGALGVVAAASLEPDVAGVVLMIAGSTTSMARRKIPEWIADGEEATRATDPATYAGGVDGSRVLMLNAVDDDVFDLESAGELAAAFRPPARIETFAGTHIEWHNPAELNRRILAHLRSTLAPGTTP